MEKDTLGYPPPPCHSTTCLPSWPCKCGKGEWSVFTRSSYSNSTSRSSRRSRRLWGCFPFCGALGGHWQLLPDEPASVSCASPPALSPWTARRDVPGRGDVFTIRVLPHWTGASLILSYTSMTIQQNLKDLTEGADPSSSASSSWNTVSYIWLMHH